MLIVPLAFTDVFGQADSVITSRNKDDVYNALRFGIGTEKSPYLELGYSKLILFSGSLAEAWTTSYCFYGAGQIAINKSDGETEYLYGGKVGFEMSNIFIFMFGAEIKFMTESHAYQFYFTPKAGLTLMGGISILYGYNLTTHDDLASIGNHQFSLTMNLSRKMYRNHFK